MAVAQYHKRRVPAHLQGIVVGGTKLGPFIYVALRDGITRSRAESITEDMIAKAKARANYRMTEADAWGIAIQIVEKFDATEEIPYPVPPKGLSKPDHVMVEDWITRIVEQKNGLYIMSLVLRDDDPEAYLGLPKTDRSKPANPTIVRSARSLAGVTPLHSDVTTEYFAAKTRSKNYRRALEQFREECGDLPVGDYTADHVWTFRNWLDETKDEKKGEVLSGKTKNNKMSAISSLFGFAIEKRYRNGNPTRDVKWFSREENRKKRRRLYTKQELTALFIRGERDMEWHKWTPLFALYAGMRLRESMQLKPENISNEFGVWHFIIRPGRGQIVKGGRERVVPIHKELIRLGILDVYKRAVKRKQEWLLADVPLVAMPGKDFNAPDVELIEVPSQNAGTQWFGRYSDQCGVTDSNVDFHALRGCHITYGSQQGKQLSLRMELAGHAKAGVHQTYIYAGASLKSLKSEIDHVDFPIRIPK